MFGFSSGERLKALCKRAAYAGVPLEEHEWDDTEGALITRVSSDPTVLLEANKARQFEGEHSKEFRLAARIDPVIWMQWCKEDGVDLSKKDNRKALLRRLNDPENQFLRVWPGKL